MTSKMTSLTPQRPVFLALMRKDAEELLRTWRFPLLATTALLLAVSGPFVAQYLTEIIGTIGGDELKAALSSTPEPTAATAHTQWIKDLNQVFLIVVAVVSGSSAASELGDGSYLFTLTRHIPRWKFLVSKFLCALMVPAATVVVATLCNIALTVAIFGEAQIPRLLCAVSTWFLVMALVVACAFFVGVATLSQVGAAGAAMGTTMLLQVLATWAAKDSWNPAGLIRQTDAILAGQSPSAHPVIVALGITAALCAAATGVLNRKEL